MQKPNLRALVQKHLVTSKLEPAAWLGDDGRDFGKPVPLNKLGIGASLELAQYIKLAETARFRQSVAALLQKSGSYYWGIVPVRVPSTLLFEHSPSTVVAFLMGSCVLGSDPDSGAYLTATWSDAKSQSLVASFLFNDVDPSDKTPGDFVVDALSIESFLAAYGGPKQPRRTLPECAELARLYRRGIWISQLIQEDAYTSIDDIERTVLDASPPEVYAHERDWVATHAHIAAYWLLSHALLGHTELLADALVRTQKMKTPAIVDLRKQLAPVAKASNSIDRVFSKHRRGWTKSDFKTLARWGSAK